VRDLRLSGRSLIHNYGYSSVALLTLAIGVGFSTAVFSSPTRLRSLVVASTH
jgi:hypothetical protein